MRRVNKVLDIKGKAVPELSGDLELSALMTACHSFFSFASISYSKLSLMVIILGEQPLEKAVPELCSHLALSALMKACHS